MRRLATLLSRVASLVVERRWLVQLALAATTIAFVVRVPELRVELSPADLVAEQESAARRDARLAEWFGPKDEPLLVVARGNDVLSRDTLAWLDATARFAFSQPWSIRVNGPTVTPVPHHVAEDDTAADLDAIERDPSALDVAPDLDASGETLAALAASDPVRFPNGLVSLAELHEGARIVVTPLAENGAIDPRSPDVLRERLAAHDPAVTRLVAPDGRLAVVAMDLRDDAEAGAAVADLERYLAGSPPPRGITASLGGLPSVRIELSRALRRDRESLIAFACVGSVLMLLVGFRSLRGVLLPMAAVGMTMAIAMGGMAAVGEPITLLTNVVPPLLVTIGLGDAVFLVARYDEERAAGHDRLEASRRTLRHMAVACFLTSATTAAGFGSLAVSGTPVLRHFGLTAAAAVMAAYLITILFIPSALPWFRGAPVRSRAADTHARLLDRGIDRVAALCLGRPRAIAAFGLLAGVACASFALGLRTDSGLLDQLDAGSGAAQTTRALERNLHGVRVLDVALESRPGTFTTARGLRSVAELEERLASEPDVLAVTSAADVYRSTWALVTRDAGASDALATDARTAALSRLIGADGIDPLRRWVTPDGGRARVEVRVADAGVGPLNDLIDRIEARLRTMPGTRGFIGGEAYVASRGLGRLVRDLATSLALAIVVIFAMLALALRSPRLALIGLPPNLVPLCVTIAWMAIRGIPLHASTIIVFAIGVGLAVDGTIHVLARYREERARGGTPDAIVRRAIHGSGRPIALGAGALLLGFTALLTSGFPPIRLFGELSAVTIVAAVISELTLLPALLVLFAEKPPRQRGAGSDRAS